MSYSDIYPLSEFQHANLVRHANGESIVFALLEPSEQDTAEQRQSFEKDLREAEALITLGLIQNVSDKFTEPITLSKLNRGRGYQVFMLTPQALSLFHDCGERPVN